MSSPQILRYTDMDADAIRSRIKRGSVGNFTGLTFLSEYFSTSQ